MRSAGTCSAAAGSLACMATWDALRDLPLRIDSVATEVLSRAISPEFTRRTTVVHLYGEGEEGIGEDVVYDAAAHDEFPELPAGEFTLASFSAALEETPLIEPPPQMHAFLDYRRWAVESAALDLALRQADTSLGQVLKRQVRPVRFV